MDKSYISIDELKQSNTRLKDETQEINNLFMDKIMKALDNCQEDLKVAGLNYDEIKSTFQTLFNSITNQLNEFTSAMDSSIIPKYEATAASIANLFNNSFANELNGYLNQIKSE